MPEITLNLPSNSRFNSSLNEIDSAIGAILLKEMRIADPRDILGKQGSQGSDKKNNWLWDESRVFQVDDLNTEEIFNTYLLRKKVNNKKGTDVSYPILAYIENDIDTVFWDKSTRFRQWYFDIPVDEGTWEVGDTVCILEPIKYRGIQAQIDEIQSKNNVLYCKLTYNNSIIKDNHNEVVWFNTENLRPTGDKLPSRYKAKAITGTYSAVVLTDTRDEAQYIRDKFILRCMDSNIWFTYHSPTINSQNQIYAIFGIPNINRYPASKDKLKGAGYIYGISWNIDIWGCLTDEPLPVGFIENIRMNLHVDRDERVSRIVING